MAPQFHDGCFQGQDTIHMSENLTGKGNVRKEILSNPGDKLCIGFCEGSSQYERGKRNPTRMNQFLTIPHCKNDTLRFEPYR